MDDTQSLMWSVTYILLFVLSVPSTGTRRIDFTVVDLSSRKELVVRGGTRHRVIYRVEGGWTSSVFELTISTKK